MIVLIGTMKVTTLVYCKIRKQNIKSVLNRIVPASLWWLHKLRPLLVCIAAFSKVKIVENVDIILFFVPLKRPLAY